MKKSEWTAGLLYLGLLAALALAGRLARRDMERTCEFDGGKIDSRYSVRIVDTSGKDRMFCCIVCAESWVRKNPGQVRAICVVDETSGQEIDAAAASFVRSLVITNRTTGNRIHAFRTESAAEEHVRSFGGSVLEKEERPFADRAGRKGRD